MRILSLAALCGAVALITGCDTAPELPPSDPGEHSTRVTGESIADGAFDDAISGPALFAVALFTDVNERRFEVQLQMEQPTRYHQITIAFPDEARPAVQTYPCDGPLEGIADSVRFEYLRLTGPPLFRERFRGTEGEVVITAVSEDEISGTVDCSTVSAGGTQTVEVVGSFRARQGG